MTDGTTLTGQAEEPDQPGGRRVAPEVLALVIAWSTAEPGRAGEVAVVPTAQAGTSFSLGRGVRGAEDERRLDFARQRAGVLEPAAPLASPTLSRRQLLVRRDGVDALSIANVGRPSLAHNGRRVDEARVVAGDTVLVGSELLLLCVRRPAWLRTVGDAVPRGPFGEADPHGLVGESPAAWELRRQIAFVAAQPGHVLVTGPSGTGKEHAARAIHALSARRGAALVARSAATLPEGLVDAELFGHAKNYPNAGMPERPGLVAQATGGTLLLDEIAELPVALQTHLLRVLDAGEYQRLGESAARTSDFRLIAATNAPERLRADLAARFPLTLHVPGLDERMEDVPLVAVHLLRRIASASPEAAGRLFPAGALGAFPRLHPAFIERLVRHRYTTNVRELEALLWKALASGGNGPLDGPVSTQTSVAPAPTPSATRAEDVSVTALRAALAESEGSLEVAWRSLGLTSRHVLTRLMTKHGVRRPVKS